MSGAPFAPWSLRGEAIVGFTRRRPPVDLPRGMRLAPGPCMITASRFTDSPVGPFLQLALAVPARMGPRLGWYVGLLVVNRQDARTGARLNWGFPAELGSLRWRSEEGRRELVWDDRDIVVRGRGRGPQVPLAVPHRELQSRGDGPVIVPDHMLGLFRPAIVRFHAFPGDPLAPLAGAHLGTLVARASRVISEAHTPVGLIAPLRAPGAATEPLMANQRRGSDLEPIGSGSGPR